MIDTLLAIPAATWATFLLASWALNLTPGSDVMFISASGAAGGRRAGMAAGIGVSFGSLLHVALAAIGVASLLAASDLAFTLLRWAGAAYLIWLAVTLWTAPPPEPATAPGSTRRAFLRGALNCALNPKVSVFVLAFLPQFTDPARGPVWQQITLLGVTFALASIPINLMWGVIAGTLGSALRRFGRTMNRVSAAVLALLAARLAWS